MKSRLLLAAAALSLLAGCKPDLHGPWPKPELAAHRVPAPTDGDGLAAELELGQRNYFALQDYYLGLGEGGFPKKFQRVHELSTEEAAWASEAVAAQSQALARLLPEMEKALKGRVATMDAPLPAAPKMSLAILDLESAGPWSLAQARSNLAGYLAYLYRVRRSARADEAKRAEAALWAEEGRVELARITAAARP